RRLLSSSFWLNKVAGAYQQRPALLRPLHLHRISVGRWLVGSLAKLNYWRRERFNGLPRRPLRRSMRSQGSCQWRVGTAGKGSTRASDPSIIRRHLIRRRPLARGGQRVHGEEYWSGRPGPAADGVVTPPCP